MKFHPMIPALCVPIALAASLMATGCSSVPPVAETMKATPAGTVTTYHRKSSGSLGNFDGQVVWTAKMSTWEGKPVLAVASAQGTTLHDTVSHGQVASLSPAGQPVMSFNPPIAYQWPLSVGKTWTSEHTITMYPSGAKVPLKVQWKVESWGDVTVPAGTFKAYKVTSTNNLGEVESRWTSPQDGIGTIRRVVTRPASHPQGPGELEGVLLSDVRPGR